MSELRVSEFLNSSYNGFTGSQGDIGFTGSIGFAGSQGAGFTGSKGDIGFTGSIGFSGSQGITGFTGSLGFTGSTGFTGSIGFTGSRGLTGFDGSRGDTGFTGSIGFSGSQGITGFTGSIGDPTLINAANDTATTTLYPTMVSSADSNQTAKITTSKLYFNAATGTLSATELNSLSDITLKKDVKPIENALSMISKIDGIEFSWIENDKKSYGVIAQQIENLIPDLVNSNEYKSVNYSGMIAFLIQAIKELNKKLDSK